MGLLQHEIRPEQDTREHGAIVSLLPAFAYRPIDVADCFYCRVHHFSARVFPQYAPATRKPKPTTIAGPRSSPAHFAERTPVPAPKINPIPMPMYSRVAMSGHVAFHVPIHVHQHEEQHNSDEHGNRKPNDLCCFHAVTTNFITALNEKIRARWNNSRFILMDIGQRLGD